MSVGRVSIISTLSILTSCSTFPQPKDVTPHATVSIVHRIRCEAKEALATKLIEALIQFGDKKTKALASELIKDRENAPDLFAKKLQEFDLEGLNQDAKDRLKEFGGSSIGYSFRFQITESNDNNVDTAFRMPFTGGIFTLGFKAGSELERKGLREFKLVETFFDYADLECNRSEDSNHIAKKPDWAYPISGRIGVADVIDTFFGLVDDSGSADLDTYADTLTFTTKISGSINPKIEMDSVVDNKFKLIKADLSSSTDRTDLHEVKIELSLPVPEKPEPKTKKIKLAEGVVLLVDVPAPELLGARVPSRQEVEKANRARELQRRLGVTPADLKRARKGRQKVLRELRRQEAIDILDRELQENE